MATKLLLVGLVLALAASCANGFFCPEDLPSFPGVNRTEIVIIVLKAVIRGRVLTSEDAEYYERLRIDNALYKKYPAVIVLPIDEWDVSHTLLIARTQNVYLTVKGGGHSAAGYCLNSGGIVLDMAWMNATSVDTNRLTIYVQGGVQWRNLYKVMNTSYPDIRVVGGTCDGVGVGGFMLGGGISSLSRSYGLGCDNIINMTVVTASGLIVTVGNHSTFQPHKDLFWAMCGGGGGNFGVVTSMHIQAYAAPQPQILFTQICWDYRNTTAVLPWYNTWESTIPNAMTVYGWWRFIFGRKTFCLNTWYNGAQADGLAILQPAINFDPAPFRVYSEWRDYYDYELFYGSSTAVAESNAIIKSGTFPAGAFTESVAQVFADAIETAPSDKSLIVFLHLGGKMAEKANNATAYHQRTAHMAYQVKSIYNATDSPTPHTQWAQTLHSGLASSLIGAYLNYIDPFLPNWQTMYYGSNYARLQQVKSVWDPCNFFRFNQSIELP